MKRLILLGLVFFLAWSVLGCDVKDESISDTVDPEEVETLDPQVSSDEEKSSEDDTVLCYVVDYDAEKSVLTYDPLEWIDETDTERIEELGLDVEYDFPNAFYIYNENEVVSTMKVSADVTVLLVNLEDSLDPITSDMDGLLEHRAEYESPYELTVEDDMIYIIKEQFIP